MLAKSGRIKAGHGVDRSKRAIRDAQRIASDSAGPRLRFQVMDSLEGVPSREYDVVSLVDVVHHVPKSEQIGFLIEVASKLRPGGTLIYKDISAKHLFWRFFNTLHDLAKAREFVNYVSDARLMNAARQAGLEHCVTSYVRKLWYMHVIYILRKPVSPSSGQSL